MTYYKAKNAIQSTMRIINSNENFNIRSDANGGNSILIICDPKREAEYIDAMNDLMLGDTYDIIDLNEVLCEFISNNSNNIEESFELLKGSIYQIFKLPPGEKGVDFFQLILEKIRNSYENDRVPILIHTGVFYGSGIENIQLTENSMIMNAPLPLIILYPATNTENELYYLDNRAASKYRCLIIE